jgi:hypothetical protein
MCTSVSDVYMAWCDRRIEEDLGMKQAIFSTQWLEKDIRVVRWRTSLDLCRPPYSSSYQSLLYCYLWAGCEIRQKGQDSQSHSWISLAIWLSHWYNERTGGGRGLDKHEQTVRFDGRDEYLLWRFVSQYIRPFIFQSFLSTIHRPRGMGRKEPRKHWTLFIVTYICLFSSYSIMPRLTNFPQLVQLQSSFHNQRDANYP